MGWSIQSSQPLSDLEFKQWRELIEERTGIELPMRQRGFLQVQLSARMREINVANYDEYFKLVTAGRDGVLEWTQLVDRLVIKETQFFRHRPSLEFVRNYLQRKIASNVVSESVEIWSVGCATGEEPYSLAMIANDCFLELDQSPYYGVTGLDISPPALQHGRLGIYGERKVTLLTEDERRRYMSRIDPYRWQVVSELRQRVCFSQGNLLQLKAMPLVKMDVIFCQNLLIYFRHWRRREILNELVNRLKPGGLLVIGMGEALNWHNPLIKSIPGTEVQAFTSTV